MKRGTKVRVINHPKEGMTGRISSIANGWSDRKSQLTPYTLELDTPFTYVNCPYTYLYGDGKEKTVRFLELTRDQIEEI